jgi:hypothetical protein
MMFRGKNVRKIGPWSRWTTVTLNFCSMNLFRVVEIGPR